MNTCHAWTLSQSRATVVYVQPLSHLYHFEEVPGWQCFRFVLKMLSECRGFHFEGSPCNKAQVKQQCY